MPAFPDSPNTDAVLANLGWVQSLARSLVSSGPEADDLAQETWRRALENPPPKGLPLRPWLMGILRRTANDQRRSAARRKHREQVAAREEASPTDQELQDRMDQSGEMAALVMELEEPYRRIVLLRYFEGLGPQAIAQQESLPLGTVKTRLRRALETLRSRVDARHSHGSQAWLLLLAGKPTSSALPLVPVALAMQSKIFATAAILLAIGGAVWWSQSGGADPLDAAPGLEAPSALAVVEPQESNSAPIEVSQREMERAATAAPVVTMLSVRAVDQSTGEVLTGAQFWTVPYAELPRNWDNNIDLEPIAVEKGTAWQIDPEGKTHVPESPTYRLLVARAGEYYGTLNLHSASPSEITVECQVDRSLRIQVVDAHQDPVAGVSVVLQKGLENSRDRVFDGLTSAPDGIAEMHHLNSVIPPDESRSKLFNVAFRFPVPSQPLIPFDPESASLDPVILTLPPTGSMTIDFVGPDGDPFPLKNWIYITPIEQHAAGGTQRGSRHGYYLEGASQHVLPHIGLGLELIVQADPGGQLRTARMTTPGPQEPGEHVRVQVVFDEVLPAFRGRILKAGGGQIEKPWRPYSTTIDLLEEQEEGASRYSYDRAFVSEDGQFLIPITEDVPAGARCRVRILRGQKPDGPEPAYAEFDSRVPAAGETSEVGDVVFRRVPLIAAGTVRDTSGNPLKDVDLQTAGKRSSQSVDRGFKWSLESIDLAYTDAEGRFEIRGFLPPGEYALWPRLHGFQNRGYVPFAHGQRGIELVLDSSSNLLGRILIPASIPKDRLHVELRYQGAAPQTAFYEKEEAPLGFSGDFHFTDLRAGTLDLVVRSGQFGLPLFVQESIEIRPGATGEDASIPTIDLRSELRFVKVLALGDAGAPVERGYVSIDGRNYQLLEGRAEIVTKAGTKDLAVHAAGYLASNALAKEGETVFHLDRTVPVRVQLTTELPPAPEGTHVFVGLYPREGFDQELTVYDEAENNQIWKTYWLEVNYERIDGRSDALLYVPGPGDYRLQWMVQQNANPTRGATGAWIKEFRQRVRVEAAGTSIQFDPDLEAYHEACRQFD